MRTTATVAKQLPIRIRVCLQAYRKSLKNSSALAAFTLALLAPSPGFAQAAPQRVCTGAELKEAQKEADQLTDWDSMYRSFKRFAHCDEGGIAEAYSDSVGRLLARDWKHLDAFVRLTADQSFEEFVIRHVDETMSEDEAALVINNARLHCPPGAKRLCKSIADY